MVIIIKKIPEITYLRELYEHVAPALKRPFPFKSGQIVKTEILALHDKHNSNVNEFHGLVHIEPEQACRRAIQKLKSKRFKNKLVIVKEYSSRDYRNDKRIHHSNLTAELVDKRRHDRRRDYKIELINEMSRMYKPVNPTGKSI